MQCSNRREFTNWSWLALGWYCCKDLHHWLSVLMSFLIRALDWCSLDYRHQYAFWSISCCLVDIVACISHYIHIWFVYRLFRTWKCLGFKYIHFFPSSMHWVAWIHSPTLYRMWYTRMSGCSKLVPIEVCKFIITLFWIIEQWLSPWGTSLFMHWPKFKEGSSINCTTDNSCKLTFGFLSLHASWLQCFIEDAVLDHPKKCNGKGLFQASKNWKSTVQKVQYNA